MENIKIEDFSGSSRIAWSSESSNVIQSYNSKIMIESDPTSGLSQVVAQGSTTNIYHLQPLPDSNHVLALLSGNTTSKLQVFDCVRSKKIYSQSDLNPSVINYFNQYIPGSVACNASSGIAVVLTESSFSNYQLFDFRKCKIMKKRDWLKTNGGFPCDVDFNPEGTKLIFIDDKGSSLLTNVSNGAVRLKLRAKGAGVQHGRLNKCKWNPKSGSPIVAMKYDLASLNLLDIEKQAFLLTEPNYVEKYGWSMFIDWNPDGNLVACAGCCDLHIYDQRTNEVARSLKSLHIDYIKSVRWNKSGTLLVTGGNDGKVKVVDFASEKVYYTGSTLNDSNQS
mmetsp:Transcript_68447/g.79727  ORF Transcript_68447/g.79727 Transcript_68447/m.79727 type:complete len:336 (+) Transcript_68447:1191-2198(+)